VKTIPEVVDAAAERFPDVEALVDGELRLTFAELRARIDEAARALVATGIHKGDRIGVWAPNMAEWIFAAVGVHRAGGVLVPINTRFKGQEAADLLERSGARLLFTSNGFLDTDYTAMLDGAGRPSCVEDVIDLRGPSWDDFLARASEHELPIVDGDDICDILFTSGTTGRPKGAMLRHGATVKAFQAWADIVGLQAGDRYLIVNPFFHSFGLKAGILACLLRGATMIPHPVFDVPSVMRRVEEERVTVLPGPPAIYQTMLDHPDAGSRDLSSLRLAVTGAAPVPVEMIRRMRTEMTFKTIVTAYGLTEATGVVTVCRHDDPPEVISGTSGRAIPDVEVRVVEDGRDVTAGDPGELLVRGYNVMAGYLDDPEATAEAIDADGWLHTGDVAVMDEQGYVKITDRTKDMFIVGGFNAYPAEIEQALAEHPSISRAAVVGVPDERLGEVGRAFVVPRAGATVEPDDVIAWSRERMANYKVPRSVVVVDELPLNASGKVLKYELRNRT
jgi:HIP---CoA ligase